MSRIYNFVHSTGKSEYNVKLTLASESIQIFLQEKFSVDNWSGSFNTNFIEEQLSKKTGNPLSFQQFSDLLLSALEKKEDYCYVDILTSQDLQNLRAKKGEKKEAPKPSAQPKSNKRYVILTSMRNDQRVHYPLPLNIYESQTDQEKLKAIYKQLREELDNQRLRVMNETSKSEQSSSFSINYEKKGSRNHDGQPKEIDQLKSENEILKSKLKRLQEQAQKKAGSDMEAIVQRKNQLQKQLETPNMKLVDLRYNVEQQQEMYTLYKAQLLKLHKQISQLLVTDKEIKVKKHAEEVERDLQNIRKVVNKNTAEIQKLKTDLEKGKQFNKQLEIKAKKLNTEKDVIKRGRRGPYSSYSGSVRSGSSRASSFGGSVSSKRSNYSYNSQRFR